MRVRVHRGSHEIGGSCVEIEADGQRLVVDLGRPLWADGDQEIPLPDVPGLQGGAGSLLGLLLSHPHLDHYGLVGQVDPSVLVFIGEAPSRILEAAAFFVPSGIVLAPRGHLRHRRTLEIGPFRVTPFLQDHSAFDAYGLYIQAEGRGLYYSGDFRGHGRKRSLFHALLRHPPAPVHALLMEGTQVRAGAENAPAALSEELLEEQMVAFFRETPGLALVAFSAQNIDRLVTVYRASRKAGRELVVDLYGLTVAQATGHATIPQLRHDGLRVIVPQNQRVRVKRAGEFQRVRQLGRRRIYAEALAEQPERWVVVHRAGLQGDLERAGCLAGARMAWSLWAGYLKGEGAELTLSFLARNGISLERLHSSGHADVSDLQALVRAMRAERVVPIHTEAPGRFPALFDNVEPHADGEWWEV